MPIADGIEVNLFQSNSPSTPNVGTTLHLNQHTLFTAVELLDRTDIRNELVHEHQWLLHPSEKLQQQGNLFVMESQLDQSGIIAVKYGPIPQWRGYPSEWDIQITPENKGGFTAILNDDPAYPWQVLHYQGGIIERTRTLHQAQQQHYGNLELNFLSNTWGDRSQDSRICESFMLKEIQAAKRIGVEVVQLDDGWQKGRTANSVEAAVAHGRWEGFQNGDVSFWSPDPMRFPNGLEPVIEAAKQAGVAIGLWYAPDSANSFVHWEKDVQTVMHLHQRYGVRHFKFDSINTRNRQGEINLYQFMDAVRKQSNDKISVDLDITSGCRPGYLGYIACGPLFVANRYTDAHSYWPHHVLRMLWQLCHWVDPRRLRLMLLNHARNQHRYADDPLAPHQIAPATLFAPLMFCQPLGWFELSHLPESYFQQIKPLVELWKQHRQAIHTGTVLPIGHIPNGLQWSGMMSVDEQNQPTYVLILNGQQRRVDLTAHLMKNVSIKSMRRLAGCGDVEVSAVSPVIDNMEPNSFWFGICA
jgi:alpha-galactosidase